MNKCFNIEFPFVLFLPIWGSMSFNFQCNHVIVNHCCHQEPGTLDFLHMLKWKNPQLFIPCLLVLLFWQFEILVTCVFNVCPFYSQGDLSDNDLRYLSALLYNGFYAYELLSERFQDSVICGICGVIGQVHLRDGNEKNCCSVEKVSALNDTHYVTCCCCNGSSCCI